MVAVALAEAIARPETSKDVCLSRKMNLSKSLQPHAARSRGRAVGGPKVMDKIHCPQCASTRLHRSRRQGLVEQGIRIFGGHVQRCHDCNTPVPANGRRPDSLQQCFGLWPADQGRCAHGGRSDGPCGDFMVGTQGCGSGSEPEYGGMREYLLFVKLRHILMAVLVFAVLTVWVRERWAISSLQVLVYATTVGLLAGVIFKKRSLSAGRVMLPLAFMCLWAGLQLALRWTVVEAATGEALLYWLAAACLVLLGNNTSSIVSASCFCEQCWLPVRSSVWLGSCRCSPRKGVLLGLPFRV